VKLKWIAFSALALLAACQPAKQVPGTPTGFSATAASSTQINLAWTAVADATGYILERKTGTAGSTNPYSVVDSNLPATPTNFSNNGLTANTDYTYRLKAKNDVGESANGAEASAKTQVAPPPPPPPVAGAIKLSPNKRFFLTSDNKPFVYLADNAWYLFQHLSVADADKYFTNRAAKGFTVIQASVVWEYNPDTTYGETTTVGGLAPFTGNNPATPNETYFKRVDEIIDAANSKGLYVALNPMWRDRIGAVTPGGATEYFDTEAKAKAFAEFLGDRYKAKKVLWVLGVADDVSASATRKALWKAVAQGLRDKVGTGQFITFMPKVGAPNSTTSVYPTEPLFDVDMVYSGESIGFYTSAVAGTLLNKGRPVVDGQSVFEDFPQVNFGTTPPTVTGRATDADTLRIAYWNFFGGAAGHTYGHHNVWQFLTDTTTASSVRLQGEVRPQIYFVQKKRWDDPTVLDSAGAVQMGILKKLLVSRPLTDTRTEIAVLDQSSWGTGITQTASLLAENLSFAMSFIPKGPAKVKASIGQINGTAPVLVRAWWFNPVTGAANKIQEDMDRTADVGLGIGVREFSLPNTTQDWVLVLDNQAANLGTPGQ
jgi:hypothetical protein